MGELIVVTGPPGAGKSTVARALSGMFEHSVLVAGDAFFGFVDQGAIPPWQPEASGQNEVVIDAAAAAAGRFAAGGYLVVYDGVVGSWLLDGFAAASGLDRLHYVVLLPAEEICVARVRTRVRHGFTDVAATRHMHRQFAGATLAQRHQLTDPPTDPADTAAVIWELMGTGSLWYSP